IRMLVALIWTWPPPPTRPGARSLVPGANLLVPDRSSRSMAPSTSTPPSIGSGGGALPAAIAWLRKKVGPEVMSMREYFDHTDCDCNWNTADCDDRAPVSPLPNVPTTYCEPSAPVELRVAPGLTLLATCTTR